MPSIGRGGSVWGELLQSSLDGLTTFLREIKSMKGKGKGGGEISRVSTSLEENR